MAMRGLERFFLKEFLSPVWPANEESLIGKRQLERCLKFEERKQKLYASASCVLGDVLMPVVDFFRENGHYYAVTEAAPDGHMTAQRALYLPDEEKYLSTKDELLVKLCSLLGGRAAEQVVFGVKTTGAANDLQRATSLVRNMVTQYGMSDALGLMAPATVQHQYLEGNAYLDCSQDTSAVVDQEMRTILDQCYAESVKVLTDNRALLDEIAQYLLLKETITGDELMAFVNKENPETETEPVAAPEAEQPQETDPQPETDPE
jgi:cell division protease FtsH